MILVFQCEPPQFSSFILRLPTTLEVALSFLQGARDVGVPWAFDDPGALPSFGSTSIVCHGGSSYPTGRGWWSAQAIFLGGFQRDDLGIDLTGRKLDFLVRLVS